jgi:hypothetical protein
MSLEYHVLTNDLAFLVIGIAQGSVCAQKDERDSLVESLGNRRAQV